MKVSLDPEGIRKCNHVHGDVDKLDKVADETHDSKANSNGF
jgi:hypothetical protein